MAKPKTCLECQQFYFDGGSPHYSDLTPGSKAEISCLKGRWKAGYNTITMDFRDMMKKAPKCPDFERYDPDK